MAGQLDDPQPRRAAATVRRRKRSPIRFSAHCSDVAMQLGTASACRSGSSSRVPIGLCGQNRCRRLSLPRSRRPAYSRLAERTDRSNSAEGLRDDPCGSIFFPTESRERKLAFDLPDRRISFLGREASIGHYDTSTACSAMYRSREGVRPQAPPGLSGGGSQRCSSGAPLSDAPPGRSVGRAPIARIERRTDDPGDRDVKYRIPTSVPADCLTFETFGRHREHGSTARGNPEGLRA